MKMDLKKLIAILIVLSMVITGLFSTTAFGEHENEMESNNGSTRNSRATLYVGSGQTYSKIQDAVDNASTGDKIVVLSGTYYENVAIDKTLTLQGNDTTNTIINGSGSGSVITIKADWVNVSGFRVTDSGSGWWSDAGILLDTVENCNIKDVNFTGNKHGIMLIDSNKTSITECDGYYNLWNFINFTSSDENYVANCTTYGSPISIDLTELNSYENNSNYFEYNDIVNSKDIGIRLHNSDGNTFYFNNIINSKNYGVRLGGKKNNFFYNNFISNNQGKTQVSSTIPNNWNYSNVQIGNHWSDWVSPDNNSNGIVDSPYVINANKRIFDWYPLVNATRPGGGTTPPQNQPPRINNSNVQIAYVNQLYSVKYTAIDPDTPQKNLTWSIKTNANWLTFDSNQTLFGTPNSSDIGSFNVQIWVSDGMYIDATNFTLTVFNRSQPPSNGTVLNVRTQVRYKTISKAVSEAKAGDTLKVYANTYTEDVLINKALTLEGDMNLTILEANSTNTPAMEIRSVNTTVSGFRVRNSNTGILLDGSIWSFNKFDIVIKDCMFESNTIGLKTMYERGFGITNCVFKKNSKGIEIKNSYNGKIDECQFIENSGVAIHILGGNSSSDKITIWNNTFNKNNGASSTYNSAKIQAKDDSYKFYNNLWNATNGFGNFWLDWLTPDNNKDGIVDVPYNISGSAGAKDHRPRTNYIPNRTFPPQIITSNNPYAFVGKQYMVNYSAVDPDTPQNQLTWAMNTNASWLTAKGALGLVGTPNASHVGTYWVFVSVSDGFNKDSTNFTLTVLASAKPQITTRDVTVAYVGTKYSVTYTATDQDTPVSKLTWSMKTNATWLTFSSKSELSGTPTKSDVGSYWVHITVTDGTSSAFTNFTLYVINRTNPQPNYPGVNSSNPRHGTRNVSVNSSEVVLEFKTPMNPYSVIRALSISPNINYTLKWEKNNTVLRVIFSDKLAYNTTYKITIGTSAFDTNNNNLNSTFDLKFTTEPGPGPSEIIDVPGPETDWGALFLTAGIIAVVVIIMVFLLVLALVTKNRRRRKEEMEYDLGRFETEDNGNSVTISNGTNEMLSDLKAEALTTKKPSAFGPAEDKMLQKLEQKFQRGELSVETYEMIKESMLTSEGPIDENINDQKP
jgi:parallel beta-helix repeat protein